MTGVARVQLPSMTPSTEDGTAARGYLPNTGKLEAITKHIAALLARAESTNHVPERELCLSRVEALMLKYSITSAMIDSGEGQNSSQPVSRTYELTRPYASNRRNLLLGVAAVFSCAVLMMPKTAHGSVPVTVYGASQDVDATLKLYESLRQQLWDAINTQTEYSMSFRTSFMHTYCNEVAARLQTFYAEEVEAAATEFHTTAASTELVLSNRRALAQQQLEAENPDTRRLRVTQQSSDRRGHSAGRAAGAEADITLDGRKIAGGRLALE